MLPPGTNILSYLNNSAEANNLTSSTNFNNFFNESQLNSPADTNTSGGCNVGASGDFTN
jgi:hypothetical protein